jgi:hypothetical protein
MVFSFSFFHLTVKFSRSDRPKNIETLSFQPAKWLNKSNLDVYRL